MKTTLRHLFNYWLPPGQSNSKPASNQLVDLAVKINASCVAMLSGAEIDWDEMERQNAEWTRLVEEARPKPPLAPYAWCEDRYVSFHVPDSAAYSAFHNQLKQCEAVISQALLTSSKDYDQRR